MADTIQLGKEELANSVHMLKGCEQQVLASGAASGSVPSFSGVSPATDAFMYQMFDLGVAVLAYKTLLQNDIAALEAAQATLEAIDSAMARVTEG